MGVNLKIGNGRAFYASKQAKLFIIKNTTMGVLEEEA